jgi:predicted DNA-binding transcriptional regulator YafY
VKIDRLLAIIILLLNRRMIQAKELAERFEVSVRTIYRDIDTIARAGIPVVTYQGAGGGIGLSEGYRLDRALLNDEELAAIVTALRSLATSNPEAEHSSLLLEKIQQIIPASKAEHFRFRTEQFIVDYSDWGGRVELQELLSLLKHAISSLHPVHFRYKDAEGRVSSRSFEPYTLVLKHHQWYVYGRCMAREQFRMFKLIRMREVSITEDSTFVREPVVLEELPWQQSWNEPNNRTRLVLRFSPEGAHLAEEWFGHETLEEDADGRTLITCRLPENDWLYGFILSFGVHAEVLDPPHVRNRVRVMVQQMQNNYDGPT